MAGKQFGKDMSRRWSSWVKGVIAEAIENGSRRRASTVIYVNAAYILQVDLRYGTLSGERRGEKFYGDDGEVLQAAVNAARNVLARLDDREMGQWLPYQHLLKRIPCLRLKRFNQDSSCKCF